LVMRVACDKVGDGKGGRQAMATRAMATMWAMATGIGWWATKRTRARAARAMTMAI
jgi:hypothetical protein